MRRRTAASSCSSKPFTVRTCTPCRPAAGEREHRVRIAEHRQRLAREQQRHALHVEHRARRRRAACSSSRSRPRAARIATVCRAGRTDLIQPVARRVPHAPVDERRHARLEIQLVARSLPAQAAAAARGAARSGRAPGARATRARGARPRPSVVVALGHRAASPSRRPARMRVTRTRPTRGSAARPAARRSLASRCRRAASGRGVAAESAPSVRAPTRSPLDGGDAVLVRRRLRGGVGASARLPSSSRPSVALAASSVGLLRRASRRGSSRSERSSPAPAASPAPGSYGEHAVPRATPARSGRYAVRALARGAADLARHRRRPRARLGGRAARGQRRPGSRSGADASIARSSRSTSRSSCVEPDRAARAAQLERAQRVRAAARASARARRSSRSTAALSASRYRSRASGSARRARRRTCRARTRAPCWIASSRYRANASSRRRAVAELRRKHDVVQRRRRLMTSASARDAHRGAPYIAGEQQLEPALHLGRARARAAHARRAPLGAPASTMPPRQPARARLRRKR